MKLYGLNFGEAMVKIIEDISMNKFDDIKRNIVTLENESVQRPTGQKIEYKRQLWQTEDVRYWSQYGVTSEVLHFYKAYSVKNLWLNDNLIYSWRKDDLCYAYEFGSGNIKIYFPNRTDRRFLCNTSCLQGYNQLPKYGKLLVVTSSLKDVMTWHRLGVWGVAKQSENQLLTPEEYDNLASRFDKIFINLDDDLTGRKFSQKYEELYPVESIFVPEGKDVSGYVKKNGVFQGQELINHYKLQLT